MRRVWGFLADPTRKGMTHEEPDDGAPVTPKHPLAGAGEPTSEEEAQRNRERDLPA